MVTDRQHETDIVALGVLTRTEFDALSDDERTAIKRETGVLSTRYGTMYFKVNREQLRDELHLIYGI
ncbi:MAG: hypothetical protein ABIS06_16535 [Vicinamibacterales bacterium]